MANALFDRLPGIFVKTFGEPVDYTPQGDAVRAIRAIWTDGSDVVGMGGEAPSTIATSTLAVQASDLAPAEGDVATRQADGKTMKVVEPILPDGKGMIIATLADIS